MDPVAPPVRATDRRPAGAGTTFRDAYRVWSIVHAALLVALVLLAEIPALREVALLVLAGWIVVATIALYRMGSQYHPDGPGPALPNALTGSRFVVATLVIVFVVLELRVSEIGQALGGPVGWVLPAVLLLVEVTDFLDGRIARRLNAGAFGSVWDMENDVVYALALTLLHRHVFDLSIVVLLIGLMRPLYVLLIRRHTQPARIPPAYKLYAKITTATLTTALILATVPILGAPLRLGIVLVALSMQLVSFGWDLLLQHRA